MKILLTSVLLALSIFSYGQNEYTAGYLIDNNDRRTNVLIYDRDWKNNPETFSYKENTDATAKEGTLGEIKEFGVGTAKYVRTTVKVDISTSNLNQLTTDKYPQWEERTIFLKVVEEGAANLYVYRAPGLERFFYSVNGTPVEQLVYKMYRIETKGANKMEVSGPAMGTNKTYLNQLQLKVNCDGKGNTTAFFKMSYTTSPLQKYFREFNKCSGSVVTTDEGRPDGPSKFRLKIAPGMDFNSFSMHGDYAGAPVRSSGTKSNIRLGVEAEFVLPFFNNKWSLILEPTYQQFAYNDPYIKIDYTSIELPIGVRHYFFLSDASQIFVNGAVVVDFPFGDKMINIRKLESAANFASGLGYQWKNLSVEGRYYFRRELFEKNEPFESDYHKVSLIVGYRFSFRKRKQ